MPISPLRQYPTGLREPGCEQVEQGGARYQRQ